MSVIECTLTNNDLLEKLIDVIKSGSANTKTEIKQHIQAENIKLINSYEEQNKRIIYLEKTIEKLEARCLQLERVVRKNNILIFGLDVSESEENLCSTVLQKLNTHLQINLVASDLNNFYQIKSDKGKPIKLEFISYIKKQQIFKNVHRLRNTKIFIVNDLCLEDREVNKILQKHRKIAISRNLQAKIIGNKLKVNEEVYTVEDLEASDSEIEAEIGKEAIRSNSIPLTLTDPQSHGLITDNIETDKPSRFDHPIPSQDNKQLNRKVKLDQEQKGSKNILTEKLGKTRLQSQNQPRK